MDEIIKSIKAHLYERTTSPLFGTFAFSWGVWNYKFLMVLLSSGAVTDKFQIIDNVLYADIRTFWLYCIVYPILTSIGFIFIYPYPAKFVYTFVRNRKKELIKIRQKIEDDTPLTQEEARKIRRDTAELQLRYEEDLERARDENERLRELARSYQQDTPNAERIDDALDSADPVLDRRSDPNVNLNQHRLLHAFAESDRQSLANIVEELGLKRLATRYDMDELAQKSLLQKEGKNPENPVYVITHAGRDYLIHKKVGKSMTSSSVDGTSDRASWLWDFDKDHMRFDFEIGENTEEFFISREALEDDFQDDSDSLDRIFEKNLAQIRKGASELLSNGAFEGRGERLIKSGDIPSILGKK